MNNLSNVERVKRSGKNLLNLVKVGLVTGLVLLFPACNKNKQNTAPSDPIEPPPSTEKTMVQLQSVLTEFDQTSDLPEQVSHFADGLGDKIANRVISKDEVISSSDVKLDANNNLAKVFFQTLNTKTGQAKYQSVAIRMTQSQQNTLQGNWQELVLAKLGHQSVFDSVEESQADSISSRLEEVSNQILSEKEGIVNGQIVKHNTYLQTGNDIIDKNLHGFMSNLAPNANSAKFGGVREDGTFLIFTRENDKLFEWYVQTNNFDITNAEALALANGGLVGCDYSTREIDISAPYTAPAVAKVTRLSLDEIYDEVMGDFEFKNFNSVLVDLLDLRSSKTTNKKPIFSGLQDGKFNAYYEALDSSGYLFMGNMQYSGDPNDILNYQQQDDEIQAAGGLQEFVLQSLAQTYPNSIVQGSKTEQEVKENIQNLKSQLEEKQQKISAITSSQLSGKRVANPVAGFTKNMEDFGRKYLEDKPNAKLIASYVEALDFDNIDDNRIFNTGRVSGFDLIVLFMENGKVYVDTIDCSLPCFTYSTKENTYEAYLKGEKGKDFKYSSIVEEVIENPSIYVSVDEIDDKTTQKTEEKIDLQDLFFIDDDKSYRILG